MRATITELEILRDVAEALNRSRDLDSAMQVVLDKVSARFDLPTGWIWLLDASGGAWVAASRNLPPALADDPEALLGTCWCLDSFRNGKLSASTNVTVIHCSRLKDRVCGTGGLQYHQSVPVRGDGGQRVGLLNVASADWRELSEEELRILVTIGDMLGLAVERARHAQEASELAAVHERNRIAREIHDTIAQHLVGAALQLESAQANLELERAGKAEEAIGRALELVRSSLDDARRSVLDLRAAPLEGRTLTEAVAELAVDGVHVTTTGVGTLSARVELAVYRIAREAVNNARAHAGGAQVHVALVRQEGELLLTVLDEGVGFDAAAVASGRFGLIGMRERANLVGARLRIESTVGTGTRVSLRVPLEAT